MSNSKIQKRSTSCFWPLRFMAGVEEPIIQQLMPLSHPRNYQKYQELVANARLRKN